MLAHDAGGLVILLCLGWVLAVVWALRALLRLAYSYPAALVEKGAIQGVAAGAPFVVLGLYVLAVDGTVNPLMLLSMVPSLASLLIFVIVRVARRVRGPGKISPVERSNRLPPPDPSVR